MSARLDEHGCLVAGDVQPHVPFDGEVRGVLVGEEAEELLRRMKRGELPNTPVFAVRTYNADAPTDSTLYAWADESK